MMMSPEEWHQHLNTPFYTNRHFCLIMPHHEILMLQVCYYVLCPFGGPHTNVLSVEVAKIFCPQAPPPTPARIGYHPLIFHFCFWPNHMACRILVSQPGIEPRPGGESAKS